MKKRTLIILGLASFVLASLTQLPASLLLKALPPNVPISPQAVSGTVWAGGIGQLNWQNLQFRNLQWDLQPLALLKGQLATNIRGNLQPDGYFEGSCGIGLSGILNCTELNVSDLPAKTLTPYLSKFLVPPLTGNLQAELLELEWDQQSLPAASGNVQWQEAGIQINPQTFGNYTAILAKGDNNTRQINLTSAADAAFEINGNIAVQANGQYQSTLNLKPRNSVNDATKRLLQNFLGRPQANGSFNIREQGQLPLPSSS